MKADARYATCLGWPGAPVTIETLKSLFAAEIRSVKRPGSEQELKRSLSEAGLTIVTPAEKPCERAFMYRIVPGDHYPA